MEQRFYLPSNMREETRASNYYYWCRTRVYHGDRHGCFMPILGVILREKHAHLKRVSYTDLWKMIDISLGTNTYLKHTTIEWIEKATKLYDFDVIIHNEFGKILFSNSTEDSLNETLRLCIDNGYHTLITKFYPKKLLRLNRRGNPRDKQLATL